MHYIRVILTNQNYRQNFQQLLNYQTLCSTANKDTEIHLCQQSMKLYIVANTFSLLSQMKQCIFLMLQLKGDYAAGPPVR